MSEDLKQLEWAMRPEAQKMFGRLLRCGVEASLAIELLELELGDEAVWIMDEDE